MRRLVFWVALAGSGLGPLAAAPAHASSHSPEVALVTLEGAVDPLAARYVDRAIGDAAGRGALAVLLRIDTPGGLDSSMRRIVRAIHDARVPVACWVGPSGARAASAGAIIALGCPLAAMAPGTNIGAAHPVGFQGEVLDEKITNDAAAYARALAEERDRNPDVAEAMVRRSISLSANEALARDVIDAVARTQRDVLVALARARPAAGAIGGARIVPVRMSFMESVLHNAVDPNLAFLLLIVGLLGIVSEILHPGITIGGLFGGLAFLAALVILGMLPVNIAGILLILVGIGLMIAEAYLPGGIAGAAGLASLIAGGLFLFDASVPGAQVSRGLLIGIAISVAAFFFFVVRAVLQTRRRQPSSPTTQELTGTEGVVERALDPSGIVRARNESWTARSASGPIAAGARVRVTRVDGLTLEVEPIVGADRRAQ